MKRIHLLALMLFIPLVLPAQQSDSLVIRNFYTEALTDYTAYKQLKFLCKEIGGRICGSEQAAGAVEWAQQVMEHMGLDTVYLQECKVRCWKRGDVEYAGVTSSRFGHFQPEICALGGSVGTDLQGVCADVIEVKNFEELEKLGKKKVSGKIVFFNRPANPAFINTFPAYGSAADQRVHGASHAAKYGAVAVIVRSLTLANDHFPHTGIMRYADTTQCIPAVAIGTSNADRLSQWLNEDPELKLHIISNCMEFPEKTSYNVIGEMKGSEFPEEYIVVGGHLDAWDNGEGAHDDGVGVVHSIEALRLIIKSGIKPRHTIRVVAFMDEEVAQRGGKKFAESVKERGEKIIAAIESDRGGFTPVGFSVDANDKIYARFDKWSPYFSPYNLYDIAHGYSGVDIYPLKDQDIPLIALMTDSQRYFDYQHAPSDVFENVNRREMQLGSASIAMLIYLIDTYGWD